MADEQDRVLWRRDLPGEFQVNTETVRRWIKAGKLPKPDVDLSRRSRGWRLSTLRAAGLNIPVQSEAA
jgi:hypothetical protein